MFLAGATGVVGRRIVPLLVAEGHRVTAMTRRPENITGLRAAGAEPVVADAFDREVVVAAVKAAAPDVVMNQLTDLAAYDREANARVRREGGRNLVEAALAAGVGTMVTQSLAWVYATGVEPAREDEPLDLDAADESRRSTVLGVAESEASAREVPHAVMLRYGMFYGPGTWYAPEDGVQAVQVRAGRVVADADVTSFVHVDDAAAAAVQALDWPPGAVNVCDDEPAPGTVWLPAFCRAVGAPPPAVSDAERSGWARGADNTQARTQLGWSPAYPSWRDGFTT